MAWGATIIDAYHAVGEYGDPLVNGNIVLLTDPGPVSLKINWGDGTTSQIPDPSGRARDVDHRWEEDGEYNIVIRATFADGSRAVERMTAYSTLESAPEINYSRRAFGTDDLMLGGNGTDEFRGFGGDDRFNGGPNGDFAYGGAGDDTLIGWIGGDRLEGGRGDDLLQGAWNTSYEVGRDHLVAGAGADTLVGGDDDAQDIFRYLSRLDGNAGPDASGPDRINGFEQGQDKIHLAFLAGATVVVNANPAPGRADGDYVLYDIDSGRLSVFQTSVPGGATVMAVLKGAPALTADDFLFGP